MRGRSKVSLSLILMIFFGTVIFGVRPASAQVGTIYMKPSSVSWESPPHAVGEIFTVEVRISGVTDCYMIVFTVDWNASLLDSVDPITKAPADPKQGDCLAPGGAPTFIAPVDHTEGKVEGSYTLLGAVPGVNIGDGLVATFTFKALMAPTAATPIETDIEFIDTTLWVNSALTENQFTARTPCHFHFAAVVVAARPPKASFTYTPFAPKVNETVTFDASASESGYDGDSVTPITEYRWNFGNGVDLIVPTPVVTHEYAAVGDYTVTLEVYAPPIGYADPTYVPTDKTSKTVKVIVVIGLAIDLYSEKPDPYSGKGPDMPSDAFEPQEGITLYALITYNGEPVIAKLVAFKIQGPPNQYQNLTFERTAATNENGTASVEFRVPWPAEHAKEIAMGDWIAYARVSVAEMVATDTMPFKVGWLVEIISLETGELKNSAWIPKDSFKKGQCIGVKLTLKNICFTEKKAGFSIVVYDDLGVPIAQYKVQSYTVPPGSKVIQLWCYLYIPKWAFIGVGTVYANAYKGELNGLPYCPEASATITIEKA